MNNAARESVNFLASDSYSLYLVHNTANFLACGLAAASRQER